MAAVPKIVPVSLLGRHRILSPTAGVKVSPLCLGAMNFGEAWKSSLGECSKETAFEILDYFFHAGGNFIDTAVNYQFNESELWLGEWMEARKNRDEMVIATKFTGPQASHIPEVKIRSNFSGNSAKNIHTSVERSLKQLKTSYIDIYYIHFWDHTTSIPEIMHALNDLVTSRKVIYLGVSDTPAWLVVKMNCYARQHGLRQFSLYQGRWSAAERDFEREIIPMCMDEGMALAPWGALGGGYFKPKNQWGKDGTRNMAMMSTGKEEKVSLVLNTIAKQKDTLITSVALAYVMHKAPYTFPIVGGRKLEHLKSNIEALGLKLTNDEIKEIDGAYGFEIGFPHNMFSADNTAVIGPEDNKFNSGFGFYDYVVKPRPIPPHEGPLDALFKNPSLLS
ncbi:Aldo/keto reductase [Lojkania enalia]|uniref:Aldo/keto reductase n=1 Tax=Lojkania enalia TaxID=147567 RepID=A0A9P4KDH0_9PLEO|nr:Aldo/keto reductase [Didymosphaeria enalia]